MSWSSGAITRQRPMLRRNREDSYEFRFQSWGPRNRRNTRKKPNDGAEVAGANYIDGFNLYFGLRSRGWRRFYWLDLQRLSAALLKPGQSLEHIKYFTSRISSSPSGANRVKRQNAFLEAIATPRKTSLFFGHYLSKPVRCRKCGARRVKREEKMTDVNIALELLADAREDRYDAALLVSADSDLTGPVVKVRTLFPKKRVIVAFPPECDPGTPEGRRGLGGRIGGKPPKVPDPFGGAAGATKAKAAERGVSGWRAIPPGGR